MPCPITRERTTTGVNPSVLDDADRQTSVISALVLARALSGTVFGLDGVRVEVEANIADGLPGFHIVGLGDRALQEARERVKIASNTSGCEFPGRKVTINLAPAQLPKEGSGFDLAMAAAIVNACEERGLPGDAAWLGELALDGTLRAIRGTLAIVAHLDRLGVRRFYVPSGNVAEAKIATAATVVGIDHLRQLKAHWESGAPLEASSDAPPPPANPPSHVDLADIHGQPGLSLLYSARGKSLVHLNTAYDFHNVKAVSLVFEDTLIHHLNLRERK